MQKSCVDWIRLEDKNTIFFHMSTIVPRRRNKIGDLKDGNGIWVEDNEKLKSRSDVQGGGQFMRGGVPYY